ncbi:MAG: transcription elongation factor GreB [Bdellovibrionales bacterium]
MAQDEKKNRYITPKGLARLKEELKSLMQVERPQVVKTVAWAASNGDRSENADYQYGKRRLREIDKRVHFLTKSIEAAEVVDPAKLKSDKVVFGATVTIIDLNKDNEMQTFQIVGEDEIDIENSKISWRSPIAKALLGKKTGDEVVVKRPAGEWIIEIDKIEFK